MMPANPFNYQKRSSPRPKSDLPARAVAVGIFFIVMMAACATHAQTSLNNMAPMIRMTEAQMLKAMQQEKFERAAVAMQCGKLNERFIARFQKANAEWEAESVRSLRSISLGLVLMNRNGSGLSGGPDAVVALLQTPLPTTLPDADYPGMLVSSAERKIQHETQDLSKTEMYAYCELKLEGPRNPAASPVPQGM
jgi:hypothetical protein